MVKAEQPALDRGLNPEATSAQLELVGQAFNRGIDSVLRGDVNTVVLFEGDFALALGDQVPTVNIGNGLVADFLALAMRFEDLLRQKGNVVLKQHDNNSKDLLTNNSQALDYLKVKIPEAKFFQQRTTYFVNTNDSQLIVQCDKTSLTSEQETPLSWSWVAKINQAADYNLFED